MAAIYLSAHLNASQCALNDHEWAAAMAYATRAAKLDPANVKALFRRGVARSKVGMLEEAKADLKEAARLDPKNRAVRAAWNDLKQLILDQKKGAKSTFKGAFDKVSLFTDKPSNLTNPSETDNPRARRVLFLGTRARDALVEGTRSSGCARCPSATRPRRRSTARSRSASSRTRRRRRRRTSSRSAAATAAAAATSAKPSRTRARRSTASPSTS